MIYLVWDGRGFMSCFGYLHQYRIATIRVEFSSYNTYPRILSSLMVVGRVCSGGCGHLLALSLMGILLGM